MPAKRKRTVANRRRTGGRKVEKSTSRKLGASAVAAITALYRPLKKPVTLRIDADVLAWFKRNGRGYQTRINRALRDLMINKKGK